MQYQPGENRAIPDPHVADKIETDRLTEMAAEEELDGDWSAGEANARCFKYAELVVPLLAAANALVDYYLGEVPENDCIEWADLDDLVRQLAAAVPPGAEE